LYLLALWRCADRPDPGRAALLLTAAAAVGLSSFYGGFIAAVVSPVVLVAWVIASPRSPDERWRRGFALTALTLVAACAAGLFLIHRTAPAALLRPGAFAFPRSDLFLYSAKWWSYLVPPAEHPLLGSWVREFWASRGLDEARVEQQVGVGWSLLVLAALPLWLWLRGERRSPAVRIAPVLASVAGVALVCSLSPERTIGSLTLERPSALLYEVAPMFRAYARFGVVVGLMVALMAGAGANWLWRRPTPAARRAAALLLGLAVLENAPLPPWHWRDVLPTRAHRWLAAQPGSLRVLDCAPPSRWSDSLAVPLLGHEASLLGTPPFDDCDEPRLGDKLSAMGYTHVVVRRDSPTGRWRAARPAPEGLRAGTEFEDSWILEVNAARPSLYMRELRGFYPREYGQGASWRWMGQTGTLRLVATRTPEGTVLELELKAFPGSRRVEWFLDGRKRGALEVDAEWRRFELPLGALVPGEATVTLSCDSPATVANDVLHNGDPRAVALALGSWRILRVAAGVAGAQNTAS
jgi:hypothetical protein